MFKRMSLKVREAFICVCFYISDEAKIEEQKRSNSTFSFSAKKSQDKVSPSPAKVLDLL